MLQSRSLAYYCLTLSSGTSHYSRMSFLNSLLMLLKPYMRIRASHPSLVWTHITNGIKCVNSMYKNYRTLSTSNLHINSYGTSGIPLNHSKFYNLSWKFFDNIIKASIKEWLNIFFNLNNTKCILCGYHRKSLHYLLIICPYAKTMWFTHPLSIYIHHIQQRRVYEFI